jgi:hypothetical protein
MLQTLTLSFVACVGFGRNGERESCSDQVVRDGDVAPCRLRVGTDRLFRVIDQTLRGAPTKVGNSDVELSTEKGLDIAVEMQVDLGIEGGASAQAVFYNSCSGPKAADERAAAVHGNGASHSVARQRASGASALLAHDAAFDEHHDSATVDFIVAQAISPRCRQRLAFFEGLAVFGFHIVHHVSHGSLLCDSDAADADGDERGDKDGFHMHLLGVGSQACDG